MTHAVELLTADDLFALPPPAWLIERLVPEGGMTILYGGPGTGKSFVALDWALCLATGRPWLGLYPVKQCPVVYIAAEGGRGMQLRVRAWKRYHKVSDLSAIRFMLSPFYVREEGAIDAFVQALRMEFSPDGHGLWPGFIVLDTLSRSFGGGEENSSTDMGEFINALDALASDREVTVLVVHHTNATGARERGHTSLRGAANAMFSCEGIRHKDSGKLTAIALTNNKQKDDEEHPELSLLAEEVDPSLVLRLDDPDAEENASADVLDLERVLAIHHDGLRYKALLDASGMSPATFKRRLNLLTQSGRITRNEHDCYIVPRSYAQRIAAYTD